MISIVFAGNEKVFDGIVIASLSLVKHTRTPFCVYLFTMDLTDQNPDFRPITPRQAAYLETVFTAANEQSRVRLVDVGDWYRADFADSPNRETAYTPYTFLRLYADRVDDIGDKVLYLDADLVLNGDVTELFEQDISNDEFAGVRDYYGRWFFGCNYLNAGVLLLNLRRIRSTGLFEKSIRACAEKKIFLPDQTALNRLCVRKRVLPRRFNEQKHLRGDTVIRHFSKTILWFPWFHTQNIKPWQVEQMHQTLGIHAFDDILDDYLSRRPGLPR